jgi:hypothetical protein
MNDAWGYNDNEQNEPSTDGPKALRDAYKVQKDLNAQLIERLEKLEADRARNTAADLLESQGVARSAAKYYQGEAEPEKVTAWVNDLRSAFGAAPAAPVEPAQPVLDSNTQAQYERMNNAGQGGATMGNMDAATLSIKDAQTPAQLIAAFQNLNI